MRDVRLADLNFRELVNYGGQPSVRNRYEKALPCAGYCVSCEEEGLLQQVGGHLDLMSHGCDFADFEAVLNPMPRSGPVVERRILFLLENPGGDKENGEEVPFREFRKQPPVCHYYWTPSVPIWPVRVSEFERNFYGPYLAYLMRRHQLVNVYLTNLIKCRWRAGAGGGSGDTSVLVRHCVERFLTREIQLFDPEVVFCFGGKADIGLRNLLPSLPQRCRVAPLMHPSYIQYRHQTRGRTQEELVEENDARIRRVLAQLV